MCASIPGIGINTLRKIEEEQAVLLCISNTIAAIRSREGLSEIVRNDLLSLFNGKYYTLCLINEDNLSHSPFIFSSDKEMMNDAVMERMMRTAQSIESGIWNEVLAEGSTNIYDLSALRRQFPEVEWINAWHGFGVQEMMAVSFSNGKHMKGFFSFYADKTGSFTPDQFSLMQSIASLIGIGIANVLANEQIERQLREITVYKQQLEEENHYLIEEKNASMNFSEVVGNGEEMQKVFKMISQVAASDSTVLLLGETGTGKELIARAIHNSSGRKDKLMIKLNCAALPAALIESELFGHERGSFTGAAERRIGKFELANNSTLFLDEIGELPIELQVKLLRVLQEREVERLGGKDTIKVNVRIIAATNRNLQKEVDAGRFRSDLFYRLNVFPICLPPLRKRKEDIPALVSHFIARFSSNAGRKIKKISQVALETLIYYPWPGNVRELEHLIERSVLLNSGTMIKQIDLPASATRSVTNEDDFHIKTLQEIERDYILKVLRKCGGKISGINGAATKLGLPSTTLISKMQKLEIKRAHFIDLK